MSTSFAIAFPLLLATLPAIAQERVGESLAPFVPSPQTVVDRMLEAADLKPGETVYDLGAGDGRILITAAEKFHAKGVGVEISPRLAKMAEDQVRRMGLSSRIQIIQGDLLSVDVAPADVVTIYLLTSSNERLRPKFEKCLKRGARVVSHDFVIRGWKPWRVEKVEATNRIHTIYVYRMPAGGQ